MKKVLLIAAVACMAMTSCKKDYTCECSTSTATYDNGVKTTSTPIVSTVMTGKMKKDDAKTKCEQSNGTTMVGDTQDGVSATIACSIK